MPEDVPADRLFLDNLTLIESLIRGTAWQAGLNRDDAEEFRSHVFLKLVDRDYEVLRRFQYRSSLPAYLGVVIQRLAQDFRNQLWGKWRPSSEARRRGPLAVQLERLIDRDGLTAGNAIERVHSMEPSTSRDTLAAIARALPARPPRRRMTGEDALLTMPDGQPAPDDVAMHGRRRAQASETRQMLDLAIQTLSEENRLIVRLCFWEHMAVADVARALGLMQKPLYRRLEQILKQLRDALDKAGHGETSRELLDQLWSDFLEPEPIADCARAVGISRIWPSRATR